MKSLIFYLILTLQDHSQHHPPEPTGLDIPRTREASGTAWQPDATPMHAYHFRLDDWSFMLHGNVFVGYDVQGGRRGDEALISTNWFMLMADRPLGGGTLGLRTMLSLEPWTVPGGGYPLLFQSGEVFEGAPIHDRQHPHDLFMELAVVYSRPITADVGWQVYLAPVGEPALGPVAYPHRMSASFDPLAPLGHHWQDASHITFNVATAGIYTRFAKLEASWFNGREPDDLRTDIEFRDPRSTSFRLSVNLGEHWSVQASYGFLYSPEALEPGIDVDRWTASIMYATQTLAATFVWGRNNPEGDAPTDSFLVEATANLDPHHAVFGRAEYVQKTHHDLVVDHALGEDPFDIVSLVAGYAYTFNPDSPLAVSTGMRFSVNVYDESLKRTYGSQPAFGAMIYLRLWPTGVRF